MMLCSASLLPAPCVAPAASVVETYPLPSNPPALPLGRRARPPRAAFLVRSGARSAASSSSCSTATRRTSTRAAPSSSRRSPAVLTASARSFLAPPSWSWTARRASCRTASSPRSYTASRSTRRAVHPETGAPTSISQTRRHLRAPPAGTHPPPHDAARRLDAQGSFSAAFERLERTAAAHDGDRRRDHRARCGAAGGGDRVRGVRGHARLR